MGFIENYLSLCKMANETPSTVAEKIGIGRSNVTKWKKGSSPRMANLQKLAHYFGVTTDELLSGEPTTENELDESVWLYLAKKLKPYNLTIQDAEFLVKAFRAHKEAQRK